MYPWQDLSRATVEYNSIHLQSPTEGMSVRTMIDAWLPRTPGTIHTRTLQSTVIAADELPSTECSRNRGRCETFKAARATGAFSDICRKSCRSHEQIPYFLSCSLIQKAFGKCKTSPAREGLAPENMYFDTPSLCACVVPARS